MTMYIVHGYNNITLETFQRKIKSFWNTYIKPKTVLTSNLAMNVNQRIAQSTKITSMKDKLRSFKNMIEKMSVTAVNPT